MEIQNIFLSIIWFSGFLVLCTGALWMLKAIWDSITIMRGKTSDNKVVESFILDSRCLVTSFVILNYILSEVSKGFRLSER
jgi:hypothetical protein